MYKQSASQVGTWLSCNRKWAWQYLLGLRPEPSGGQNLGSETHKQIENYINGQPFDFSVPAGDIAASGIEHYPTLEGVQTEKEFHLQGRHHWWGYKDAERGDEVWDWKTTSDMKYAKTSEDLMYDPQAILYAKENGALAVNLNWIYLRTRGAKQSKRVHLKVLKEHYEQVFEEMENVADEIQACREGAEPLDEEGKRQYILGLTANPSQCEMYGGCPHRGLCNLSPTERLVSVFKGGKYMSTLFERMQAKKTSPDQPEPDQVPVEVQKSDTIPAPPMINPPESGMVDPVAEAVSEARESLKMTKKGKKVKEEPVLEATPVGAKFVLYLDCLPLSGNYMPAEHLFVQARAKINETMQLADYRFAQYGQGPGIFQQVMEMLLDGASFPALVVDTRVPEAIACLGTLKARASSIVQSFR